MWTFHRTVLADAFVLLNTYIRLTRLAMWGNVTQYQPTYFLNWNQQFDYLPPLRLPKEEEVEEEQGEKEEEEYMTRKLKIWEK